ncbi:MAG: hypothetical protein ACLRX6_04385 [Limosilactobacillus pontis]|uniref:Uncharacterized protein n=1 Tax=Limosilactobacillus pontis TaxID=35787 RepID=A0A2J6NN83_9LACO|nr:hypothetical protein [Limosilactobacillus pontis]PMB82753.1 hypothetical protein CK797_04825 [Limosilactobacillus pontis]
MTAEIGIGNQAGIVLAADSAVSETDYRGQVQAIYDSAQKLYTLGWQHYIGLLTYGNASYEGTPWSVLFNHYQRQVGSDRLPHVTDYQAAFLNYLCKEQLVNLPVTDRRSTIYRVADSLTYSLCQNFLTENRNSDEVAGYVQTALENIINNYHQTDNQRLAVNDYSESDFLNDYTDSLMRTNQNQPESAGIIVKLMKYYAQQINLELSGDNNYHGLFTDTMRLLWLRAMYYILFWGTEFWKLELE